MRVKCGKKEYVKPLEDKGDVEEYEVDLSVPDSYILNLHLL